MIRLRRRSDNKLGALAGRNELGGMAVFDHVVRILSNFLPDEAHGLQDGLLALVRSQHLQTFLGGKLNIDAHPVGQNAQPGD
ncbi:hypothetical protein D3C75_1222870 [compost metagenome]